MYGKIIIKTKIQVLTGVHIGGSNTFSAIGAVDSPVINDPISQRPIIPGSSLKGKLRTLLVRSIVKDVTKLGKPDEDPDEVKRLFGSSIPVKAARLQFADAFVSNSESFEGIGLTEVKFENTLDRQSGRATPRQIERVNRGVEFTAFIAYTIEDENEIEEDLKKLAKALKLLQIDYLGGHGSRGSGRVSFKEILLEPFDCEIKEENLDKWKKLFKEVESYELLPL